MRISFYFDCEHLYSRRSFEDGSANAYLDEGYAVRRGQRRVSEHGHSKGTVRHEFAREGDRSPEGSDDVGRD